MESEATRRAFLQGGTLGAGVLLSAEATAIGQEPVRNTNTSTIGMA